MQKRASQTLILQGFLEGTVEMERARLRALTQLTQIILLIPHSAVEMERARLRALTQVQNINLLLIN